MRIVLKFGGTSLADPLCLRRAARLIGEASEGNQVLVVVSAQGDTTDLLLQKAVELTSDPDSRELDAVLSAGEQVSAGLLALTLRAIGKPAISLTGWQAGIRTDEAHGSASILGLRSNRIQQELEQGRILIVTGFQGVDALGDITTLGRGGSDTTAAALAGLLHADLCRIYTDVDGVYDKDPRIYSDAVKFRRITYDTMEHLIRSGAQVLHLRSLEAARAYGMTLEVLSSFTLRPGTLVGPFEKDSLAEAE